MPDQGGGEGDQCERQHQIVMAAARFHLRAAPADGDLGERLHFGQQLAPARRIGQLT